MPLQSNGIAAHRSGSLAVLVDEILMRSDRLCRTYDLFAALFHTLADLLQRIEISRYGVALWNDAVAQQDGEPTRLHIGLEITERDLPAGVPDLKLVPKAVGYFDVAGRRPQWFGPA